MVGMWLLGVVPGLAKALLGISEPNADWSVASRREWFAWRLR